MDRCSLQGTAAIFQSTKNRALQGPCIREKAMATLRVFGMTVAAGLMAGIASTNAQDTSATYVVSYIEVAPSSAPAHIDAILAQKVETPAAANHWLRLIKALMAFAVEDGWRQDNPTTGTKRIKSRTDGFHTWTEEEICAVRSSTPGWRERRGLRLRYCSTPRNGAAMLLASGVNIFATACCISNKRKPAHRLRSRFIPNWRASLRLHRAKT